MVPSISNPVAEARGRLSIKCAVRSALLAAALFATLTAQAQPAANAARQDPLDPKASVPAPGYVSSFSQYRLLGDEKPASWRDANDTVTRIGGWRAYSREAQPPDPASSAPAASAASAATAAASAPPAPAAASAPRATPAPAAVPADKAKPMPAGHGGHKLP